MSYHILEASLTDGPVMALFKTEPSELDWLASIYDTLMKHLFKDWSQSSTYTIGKNCSQDIQKPMYSYVSQVTLLLANTRKEIHAHTRVAV